MTYLVNVSSDSISVNVDTTPSGGNVSISYNNVSVTLSSVGQQGSKGDTGSTGPQGDSVSITTTSNAALFANTTPGELELLVLINA